jgi:hypothetical protein
VVAPQERRGGLRGERLDVYRATTDRLVNHGVRCIKVVLPAALIEFDCEETLEL